MFPGFTQSLDVLPEPAKTFENAVWVPCQPDWATGRFFPLLTVKEMFPHLSIKDPEPETPPVKVGCSKDLKRESRGCPWSSEEDQVLAEHVDRHGTQAWALCAHTINDTCFDGEDVLLGKQCRERWHNHLNPDLRSTFHTECSWTAKEDLQLLKLQDQRGNCWSKIARELTGRTENSVKNRWNSLVKRGRKDLGIEDGADKAVATRLIEVMEAKK
jgi:hypothetical protein